jgi:nucleoside-diphosphate-sugar epimerase
MITGAGGFIGSYLACNLTEYKIHALSRKDLDLRDPVAVKDCLINNKYDAVIHCASRGRNDAMSMSRDILAENLLSWSNLIANNEHCGMLINLATGAEFDVDLDINNVSEQDIWKFHPLHSYGLSKNMIARSSQTLSNFYNLRIFGCFDSSEDSRRPIKRLTDSLIQNKPFVIENDKKFDMVSVEDLTTVIRAVLDEKISDKDLNIVYNQKYKLSEILKMYAQLHCLDSNLIKVNAEDSKSYTGNGEKLSAYNLPLLGLEKSLKKYKQ